MSSITGPGSHSLQHGSVRLHSIVLSAAVRPPLLHPNHWTIVLRGSILNRPLGVKSNFDLLHTVSPDTGPYGRRLQCICQCRLLSTAFLHMQSSHLHGIETTPFRAIQMTTVQKGTGKQTTEICCHEVRLESREPTGKCVKIAFAAEQFYRAMLRRAQLCHLSAPCGIDFL